MAERMLRALARLGTERALAFHGLDGLDELTITGPSRIYSLQGDVIVTSEITPEDVGLDRSPVSAIAGGDARTNADACRRVLNGEAGPIRNVVVLNAAAALLVDGVAVDLGDGVARAAEAIDRGDGARVLDAWIARSRRAADAG